MFKWITIFSLAVGINRYVYTLHNLIFCVKKEPGDSKEIQFKSLTSRTQIHKLFLKEIIIASLNKFLLLNILYCLSTALHSACQRKKYILQTRLFWWIIYTAFVW